jgi:hypothetical protein
MHFSGVAYPLLNSHRDYLPMYNEQNMTMNGPFPAVWGTHLSKGLTASTGESLPGNNLNCAVKLTGSKK